MLSDTLMCYSADFLSSPCRLSYHFGKLWRNSFLHFLLGKFTTTYSQGATTHLDYVCTSLMIVRKHLTRGFLCAVLDLSGTLWPLLIPEYSGIKRRGTPFLGLRNPGISYYGDKYPLPFYEPYGKRWLFATLSLIGVILCFVSLEF